MRNYLNRYSITITILICSVTYKTSGQRKLPTIDVKSINGETVNTSTIKNDGKPMIVFAWEITCQPCISEFNAISKVYANWKNETGVKIIAISIDDSRSSSRVTPLVRSRGWDFEVYLDPNQTFKRAMNVSYCPYVFVLDSNAEVVWQKGGYAPGDEIILYDVVQKTAKGVKIN